MALEALFLETFSLEATSQLPHSQLQGRLFVRLVFVHPRQSVLVVVMPDRLAGS